MNAMEDPGEALRGLDLHQSGPPEEGIRPERTSLSHIRMAHMTRRKLERSQEVELHRIICDHLPDQLGSPERLWDKIAVGRLVEQHTGLALPQRTLSTYLARWGFAPEKPMRSAYYQRPGLMRAWMRNEYPNIAYQTRENHGELYWLAVVPLVPRSGAEGRKKNERTNERDTPFWEHKDLSLLFIASNRGHQQWMVIRGNLNYTHLTTLVERAIHGRTRPLHLILEDNPSYRNEELRDHIISSGHSVGLYFLPPRLHQHSTGHREAM